MKAIVFDSYGSKEVLKYKEVSQPKLERANHLLVKIHATSINPVDFKIRRGEIKFLTGFFKPNKKILGVDLAGEVIGIGDKVENFKAGDHIFALRGIAKGGGYAEYICIPDSSAVLKPKNLSFEEAAAVPLTATTALQALRDKGKIKSGGKVLINGASGGVGTFAVQIAKAFGAEVTGVCSSKNVELIKSLGADEVIDYTKDDFTKSNQTFDIVFDIVANRSYMLCNNILAPKGVYITTVPNLAHGLYMVCTALFSRKKATFVMVKPNAKDLNLIKELIEDKKVKPVIDKTFPLSLLAEAHEYCEKGHARGKVVITM